MITLQTKRSNKSWAGQHGVPDILVGRSTGRLLWAACCQTRPRTQPELEQGPGHDAGKPPRCHRGAAAGTQKPFPDPPHAASLCTHTRESCEICKYTATYGAHFKLADLWEVIWIYYITLTISFKNLWEYIYFLLVLWIYRHTNTHTVNHFSCLAVAENDCITIFTVRRFIETSDAFSTKKKPLRLSRSIKCDHIDSLTCDLTTLTAFFSH